MSEIDFSTLATSYVISDTRDAGAMLSEIVILPTRQKGFGNEQRLMGSRYIYR